MVDPIRRKLLKTGAAATMMAAATRARRTTARVPPRPLSEGSGAHPLRVPSGSAAAHCRRHRFRDRSRQSLQPDRRFGTNSVASRPICGMRTAGSLGPLEIDRPWDAYTDDHLA
jgi:hypothetical protein